jgi:aspartate racemase
MSATPNKIIGLIGGMSWESTVLYYQAINRGVARRLGGLHSAQLLIESLDFEEIASLQRAGDWAALATILGDSAVRLEEAGADCLLIGANTMHLVAPEVAERVCIPLLHVADAAAQAIRARNLSRVALLGTRFTMEKPFYAERLAAQGIEVLVPDEAERAQLHRMIYEELCRGQVLDSSRRSLLAMAGRLAGQGAQGLVLGCTELPMLIEPGHTALPLFDTTALHAAAAVEFALA